MQHGRISPAMRNISPGHLTSPRSVSLLIAGNGRHNGSVIDAAIDNSSDQGVRTMKEQKQSELDCSKKCTHVVSECEKEGNSHGQCQNSYNQCVSRCAFA